MESGIILSKEFAEKYVRFANPEYLRIYIYAKTMFECGCGVLSIKSLADKLQTDEKNIRWALEYWDACGAVKLKADKYEFLDIDSVLDGTETRAEVIKTPKSSLENRKSMLLSRPSYTALEIDKAAKQNEDLDYMFKQAETLLCRTLSQTDMEMLYSFVDWLGLPIEVVVMLLTYVTSVGKASKKYIEATAIDWANKGINTYEAAESFIKRLENSEKTEQKLRRMLGIYDRALTATEKKYFKTWTEQLNLDDEMFAIAYDRTIEGTGKLSYAYMNKILQTWNESGIKTPELLKESDELYKMINSRNEEKAGVKKSKFNNYTDTNKVDYSKMAEQALDNMLSYDILDTD